MTLRVEWSTDSHLDGHSLVVVVSNDGPSLTAEEKRSIFEPFFTTKNYGTGLGMAIAKRIIDAHGGEMSVHDVRPQGVAVSIQLPITIASDSRDECIIANRSCR